MTAYPVFEIDGWTHRSVIDKALGALSGASLVSHESDPPSASASLRRDESLRSGATSPSSASASLRRDESLRSDAASPWDDDDPFAPAAPARAQDRRLPPVSPAPPAKTTVKNPAASGRKAPF
jgi:hypothetical protein